MIYFDNAATTYPKPKRVYAEVMRCMTEYCGNPGRGSHAMSVRAGEKVYECRCAVAELLHSDHPENVVFTKNTTEALNLAIKSMARRGDHILISGAEHNSVLRPVASLCGCTYDVFSASGGRDAVLCDISRKIKPNTRLIVCTHASNVCGIELPIKEIAAFCRGSGIKFIVDAAQSIGKLDIDMRWGQDAVCAPGHKGLYGPQGSGFVIYSEKYAGDDGARLATLFEGGNGVNSLEAEMPSYLPERLEAGTVATPCIAGLCEGIAFVREVGIDEIRERENALMRRLRDMLANTRGIKVYAPELDTGSIVLFNVRGKPSSEIASRLDRLGICVRGGFHCSGLAHEMLGTGEGGAVRVSFSAFNRRCEVDEFYTRLKSCMG